MYTYIYIYIYIYMYIIRLAIGHRRGRPRPLLYCPLFYCLNRERARGAPSAPDPQSHHNGAGSGTFFRPLALRGSICSICWSIGKASKNYDFLASQQNITIQTISRTWDAHVAILDQKTWLLRSPLVSFFHRFLNDLKSRKVFVFQYFSMVLASQNLSFFDQFFINFPDSLLETFLIDFLWKWSQKVTERYPKGPQRRPNGCPRVPKATKSPLKKLNSPTPFSTPWHKTLPGYTKGCPRDPKASKTSVFL